MILRFYFSRPRVCMLLALLAGRKACITYTACNTHVLKSPATKHERAALVGGSLHSGNDSCNRP